ncbi:MAG: hypothetical protein K5945_07945, partial [Bacteroidaceae bacterium]|nr:hypothetical protein [Bacteroidaceae bacterium]
TPFLNFLFAKCKMQNPWRDNLRNMLLFSTFRMIHGKPALRLIEPERVVLPPLRRKKAFRKGRKCAKKRENTPFLLRKGTF